MKDRKAKKKNVSCFERKGSSKRKAIRQENGGEHDSNSLHKCTKLSNNKKKTNLLQKSLNKLKRRREECTTLPDTLYGGFKNATTINLKKR